MSAASPSDPLGVLRSTIEAAGVPVPDQGTLEALLAVEDGNPVRAAKLIIDDHRASSGQSTAAATSSTTSQLRRRRPPPERMDFAENEREYEDAIGTGGRNGGRRPRPQDGTFAADGLLGVLYQALSLPFSLLHSLILGIARVVRLPRWIAGWFAGAGGGGAGEGRFEDEDGNTAARAFVLRLGAEDEGETTQVPQTFLQGTYNEALKRAKTDLKMLVVILTSGNETDDAAFFQTLRTHEVLTSLSRQEYLIWAASVKRKEGHLVSRQLGARQYPFLGCVAMRNANPLRHASSAPQLSLISRISGTAAISTPATIASHLSSSYARCSSLLDALQAERIAREHERQLMAEQDRAYEEVSRRDAERVAAKRAEEARLREQEQQRAVLEQEKVALNQRRLAWLKWAKRAMIAEEPEDGQETTAIHAVLPNGARLSRRFKVSDPLEHLFTWIETSGVADDEDSTATSSQPNDYKHTYEFCIFHGYPRQRLEPPSVDAQTALTIAAVGGLVPRANLIVEGTLACAVDRRVGGGGQGDDGVSDSSGSESESDGE